MQFLSKSFTPLIPSSTRRKILKITINSSYRELNPISNVFTPRFHFETKALLYYPTMRFHQQCRWPVTQHSVSGAVFSSFAFRFFSGPVGGSALKGGGHVLAVPSHASRGACCHCRYPQSRNDHAHADHSIDPFRVSNRVSKTPKQSWQPPSSILLGHPALLLHCR